MARINPEPASLPIPGSPAAAPARRSPGKGAILLYGLALVCLVQLGLIGGWVFTHYWKPPDAAGEPPSSGERTDRQASTESLKPG